MLGRNIDFIAVLCIALAMLGFAGVRSWHFENALDSIHFENAVITQRCPASRQVLLNLACLLHR